MSLKLKETFGDIEENMFSDFEIILNKQLPLEYKSFLKKNNGGRPNLNIFKTSNSEYETDIQFFFGITKGIYDLRGNYERLKNKIPKKFIAIAIDSGGNFILLDLEKEAIYYFDHEIEDTFLIANTFNDFIKGLYDLKIEESELDKAISSQNILYFKSKIEKGLQIDNIVNEFDQSIVIISSLKNKLKLLKWFVEKGAKFEMALFNACSNGHLDIVNYLLSKGANPNERDITQNNDTCLIQACYGGYLQIVKILIKNGADINLEDDHGRNALSKAYWSDNQELISYLEQEIYPSSAKPPDFEIN
jgi:hypothetical protein